MHLLLANVDSMSFGPKLCLRCAFPRPLNGDLLVLFQSVLEEINCYEPQLNRLKEKAQQLWEGQAASRSFVHRVSQLSAQYLALSNLTKVMPAMCCVCVCVAPVSQIWSLGRAVQGVQPDEPSSGVSVEANSQPCDPSPSFVLCLLLCCPNGAKAFKD